MTRRGSPILPAVLVASAAGEVLCAEVWCEWCEAVHTHSAAAGLRASHCTSGDSPYRDTGYEIRFRTEALVPAGAMPPALFAGRTRLRDTLGRAAAGMQSVLLRQVFGLSGRHSASKRIGRARINVFGPTWSIDLDAYPLIEDGCAPPPQRLPYAGGDLITLLSASHGIARGRVGVLLLEAASGAAFDVEAHCAVGSAIEAAYPRRPNDRSGCLPRPLYGGECALQSALRGAADGLRSALLRPTLGARVQFRFSKLVDGARINVLGRGWSIDPGMITPIARRSPRRLPCPPDSGCDFITLFSAVHGIGRGIVGVRLLEAVSGASFTPEAKLAIASAIEAGYARKSSPNGGAGDGAPRPHSSASAALSAGNSTASCLS